VAYRRLGDQGNSADFGVKVPVPLFDRNQGAIREARDLLAAAVSRAQTLRQQTDLALREAHARLIRAIESAGLLQREIIPQAQIALATAETRYREGDISLIEVLPLRRDRIALQLEALQAKLEIQEAWADISPYVELSSSGAK